MSGNESGARLFGRVHLHECHLAILLKELECFYRAVRGKQIAYLLFAHTRWYIRQVECGRWRKDVVEIFRAGLFKAMQWRRAKVFGET